MDAAQDKAAWSLLLDAGYLAMSVGLLESATKIFQGLAIYRPTSEHPIIGLALTLIRRRRLPEAMDQLRNIALKLNPESQIAQAVLGLALKIGGNRAEAETLFRQIVQANRDPEAVKFAQGFLQSSESLENSPLTNLVP